MPSLYRSLFLKIIDDLKIIRNELDSNLPLNGDVSQRDDVIFSNFLVNRFSSMNIIRISQKSSLKMKMDLINRVRGVKLSNQKIILDNIINYLDENVNISCNIFEKSISFLKIQDKNERENEEIKSIETICNKENYTFFGPTYYIDVYIELFDKLAIDITNIIEINKIKKLTDNEIYEHIRNLKCNIIISSSFNKIKEDLIKILKGEKEKTKIYRLATIGYALYDSLDDRLNMIKDFLKETIERDGKEPNEVLNSLQREYIDRVFIDTNFFDV